MSKKKSRRESQKRQTARGLAQGNPDELRALANRQPDVAARHLRERLLASAAVAKDGDGELLALAEQLTDRLRRAGKLSVARALAEAGMDRSARLRLERALCAFAMGDDAATERVAVGDNALDPILDILRQAASGVIPKEPPAPSPAGVRALYAVASAAVSAARGDLQRAALWARDVPGPLRSLLLADEMETAAKLAEDPLTPETLARVAKMPSSSAWSYANVRATFVVELSDKAPKLARDVARHHGLADELERRAMLRALAKAGTDEASGDGSLSSAQVEPHRVLEVIRRFGAGGFGDADVPAAMLYEAFAWMDKDKRKAARSIDSAIAQGADLVEALRARVLLATLDRGPVCAHCGVAHARSGKGLAAAADHLARALRRDPEAAPLATAASILAAEAWLGAGSYPDARASVRDARASAQTLPTFSLTLDVLEASVIAKSEPDRARALVEAVIAREPTSVVAWKARIMLARYAGDDQRADALVLEAEAATDHPSFRDEAREIRAERDEAPGDALDLYLDELGIDESEIDRGAPELMATAILKAVFARSGVPAYVLAALPDERLNAYAKELMSLLHEVPEGHRASSQRVFALLDRLLEEGTAAADARRPKQRKGRRAAARKGADVNPAIPDVHEGRPR
jgi:hypothetical protein